MTVRSDRSTTVADVGRPTACAISAMTPFSIRISLGPVSVSLNPSNSLPHISTDFDMYDLPLTHQLCLTPRACGSSHLSSRPGNRLFDVGNQLPCADQSLA